MTFLDLTTRFNKVKDGLNKPIFLKTANFLSVAVIAFHFSVLALYQLPENPLQHQLRYQLQDYMAPFFSQAWTLFAPNPINSNMSLLMRFQYEDTAGKQTTEWMDITEPLIQDRLDNFWSPAQRVSKFTQSCMSGINKKHGEILEYIAQSDSLQQDTVAATTFYQNSMKTSYSHRSVIQYSRFISNNFFGSQGKQPQEVKMQYRILTARFPRFSKRTEDYYDLDKYEFSELTSEFIPISN